ncbi:MAG: hypothetical protein WAQ56_06820 [Candidatus Nitrotoga sp.]
MLSQKRLQQPQRLLTVLAAAVVMMKSALVMPKATPTAVSPAGATTIASTVAMPATISVAFAMSLVVQRSLHERG